MAATPRRPWSKLQKQLYLLIDPAIRFQVQCRVIRMQSERGSTNLPRYWVTLDRETIWDYPGDFVLPGGGTRRTDDGFVLGYPHNTDISEISALIRDYIDLPVAQLLTHHFDGDHWGLANILRAADRRIGRRHWPALKRKTRNAAALKVLDARAQNGNDMRRSVTLP